MKNLPMFSAFTATLLMLSAPAVALDKGPPTKKPPMTNKNGSGSGKSAQHGAARNLVANGKTVTQRGKETLRSQKNNLIRAIGRAESLKPQRERLRTLARDATDAYRANPNPATLAARKAAVAAYKPVRQAHETARKERNDAIIRYRLSKLQREKAVKIAASAAGAAAPRFPTPGRPKIRRQAAIKISPIRASAAPSPNSIYQSIGLLSRKNSSGVTPGYIRFDTANFKTIASSQLDPTPDPPLVQGLPRLRLAIPGHVVIVQNAFADDN